MGIENVIKKIHVEPINRKAEYEAARFLTREEVTAAMDRVADQGHGTVFTYCASCAGNLTRGGCRGVTHLLPEILGCDEKPDIGKSMVNRMLTKFW